ncbi:MAG: DEAD/DEAH box helicase [Thermoplasmatota archaeon]
MDVWNSFDPRLEKWFGHNIGQPTEVQKAAWDALERGRNILVVSPTGSGKTLAAVIPAINVILKGEVDRSRTSIVYISPMKALGTDIVKTLTNLSEGLGRIKGRKVRKWGRGRRRKNEDMPDAKLQVGIRTGDVPQSERRRMLLDPPDLLVITPENLLLMLCSKARETIESVRWIVVDEVHEMVPGKRGALLSLTLEMLTDMVTAKNGSEPVRIGLSATVKPVSVAAKYLGGMDDRGRSRPVTIVKEDSGKEMMIEFRTLLEGVDREPEQNEKILDEIGSMIEREKGPLVVFHNTRRAAEEMAYSLTLRGYENVMPHHGSLGADVRRLAEEGLRTGELKAIISSTSLELGIDIGEVETVCQISSPKDPSKMLQRFGRSGHGLGRVSHGIIYPQDGIDLLEALAVSRAASKGKLQKLKAPEVPMDVLAQFAIGASLNDGGFSSDFLWKMCRKAYPFRTLKRSSMKELLDLLSQRLPGPNQPPPRLWYDEDKGLFLPRRNTGQAFYLNCGTIPKETSYRVVEERTRRMIGDLSRDFGETLYERDVILLGSKPYRITGFLGSKILVRHDPDAQPSVPSWSGEIMPRTDTVAAELMSLYAKGPRIRWISRPGVTVKLDGNGKRIYASVIEGLAGRDLLPASTKIPVEFRRMKGTRGLYIFLLPLGRQVTEVLGRVVAYGLRRSLGAKVDYVATDDGFAMISPKHLMSEDITSSLGSEDFDRIAKGLVLTSSMFRSRFAHCMNKSLLVLSRFRGKDTGALYKRNRVENLLGLVMSSWYSEKGWEGTVGPLRGLISLAEEALKEVFLERIDLRRCKEIVRGISSGKIVIELSEMTDGPSILGRSIVRTWKGRIDEMKEKQTVGPTDIQPMKIPSAEEMGELIAASNGRNEQYQNLVIEILNDLISIGSKGGDYPKEELASEFKDISMGPILAGLQDKIFNDDGFPSLFLPEEMIPRYRRKIMSRASGFGNVMKCVPFFTHPIELLSRSEDISYNDIRSSIKSGRLKPISLMGKDRISDRNWTEIFRRICGPCEKEERSTHENLREGCGFSRSGIGELLDISGESLTAWINEAMEGKRIGRYPPLSRDMIGETQSNFFPISCNFGKNGDRIIDGGAIERFLRYFGPYECSELVRLFGPHVLNCLVEAIENDMVNFGSGRPGPIVSSRTDGAAGLSIWFWSGRKDVLHDKRFREAGSTDDEICLMTSSDPGAVLTGKWTTWGEKEPVRGSTTTVLLAMKNGHQIGRVVILETLDLIRISDIEVDDFDSILEVSTALCRWIEIYEKMGYGTFIIEMIMGIPAGEAAMGAVGVFLSKGFSVEETPKGEVLVRGAEVTRGISREDMLYSMFRAQGLVEGYRWSHPVEIISKLGSIVDRWELLSRMGSTRYRRLTTPDPEPLKIKNELEWSSATSGAEIGTEDNGVDWSDVLSHAGVALSDIKDLTKKFSLVRGMMDQPYPVWSLEQEFSRFPSPSKSVMGKMAPELVSLLSKISKMDHSEITPFIRSHKLDKEVETLLRMGLIVEDPWGDPRTDLVHHPRHGPDTRQGRKTARGLDQRKWLLRNARRLSVFTMEDLINYSPELDDPGKVRFLIGDMVGDTLDKFIISDSGFQVIYVLKDLEAIGVAKCPPPEELKELTVISPKDRMSRVVMNDIKGTIAKGHGFSIFKGGRPVALISIRKLKRPVKNTEFGEMVKGSTSLEYWSVKKAWVDLRFRRKDLLKSIRRAFYSLGCQLITDDEKMKLESLYRDIETSIKER